MDAENPAHSELIDLIASTATPEVLLNFRPSEENQRRVAELIERQHKGLLSGEETAELGDFIQLEHIVVMAKARARQRLQSDGGS